MPRCVAAGCDNNHSHNVSFHQFPKDEILRKKWVEAVSRTRLYFQGSAHSVLCSEHFAPDDYEPRSVLASSIGLSGRNTMRLKKGVIPSIFKKPARPGQLLCNEKKKRRRSTAYEKRERSRVLNEIDVRQGLDVSTELEQSSSSPEDVPISNEAQIQTEPIEPHHCECCIHKQPKVKMTNFSVQFRTRMADKGMQIFPDDEDIRVANYDVGDNNGNTSVVAVENTKKCDTTDDNTSGTNKTEDMTANQTIDETVDENEGELKDKTEDDADNETDDETDSEPDSEDDDSTTDPDYEPFDDIEVEANEDDVGHVPGDVYKGHKFLVYEDQLIAAFQVCPMCSSPANVCAVQGTFCRIRQVCSSCNFRRIWESQPMIKNTPAGNILLSAAILFSSSCVAKSLRLLRHLRCASISEQTYFIHQRNFLLPSIETLWETDRQQRIEELTRRGEKIVLGGDGRCDSPGHSAKYGCYTLMDLNGGRIVDVQLVQSNEVGSSSAMEKEGLVRAVSSLKDDKVHVDVLVTDRHSSIKKWVRDNMVGTVHKFDIWHIAKGIKKKIDAVAKLVCGKSLKPWIRSMVNHVYWCTTSTSSGDGKVMVAKWTSIGRHMQNLHTGHGDHFPNCLHAEIEQRQNRKWLIPGSVACNKVLGIVNNPRLCSDIAMMSEKHQTSKLEAFHSLLNQFAPKTYHFSYRPQKCRTLLAVLHYNENGGRSQAQTVDGASRYAITFPKFKKGGAVVKPVVVAASYDYADKLLELVVTRCNEGVNQSNQVDVPPSLCSSYERPDKAEAVAAHRSRFSK